MDIRSFRAAVETAFSRQVDSLTACHDFRALEDGRATRGQYDAFIENVARAHLRSPQLLAFLYALAPPAAADDLRHNLLEELGLEDDSGRAHPDLLEDLLVGAGLGHRLLQQLAVQLQTHGVDVAALGRAQQVAGPANL